MIILSTKKEEVLAFLLCCHYVFCICFAKLYCIYLLPFYMLNSYLFCSGGPASAPTFLPGSFDLKIFFFPKHVYASNPFFSLVCNSLFLNH